MDRDVPEPTDLVAERQRDVEFRDRLVSHAPALVSVAIFAFVTLKVAIIARNNASTALALVGRAGPLSALTGILIEHLPALATGLSIAGIALIENESVPDEDRRRFWYYYVASVFWLSFVVHWIVLILVVAAPIILHLTLRSIRTRPEGSKQSTGTWMTTPPSDTVLRELWEEYQGLEADRLNTRNGIIDLSDCANRQQRQNRIIAAYNKRVDEIGTAHRFRSDLWAASLLAVAAIPLLQQGLLDDEPWLPAEVLTIKGEKNVATHSITGYVIDKEEKWTTILIEDDRSIRTVQSSLIEDRRICAPEDRSGKATQTLWRLLPRDKAAEYPKCPS